MARLFQETMHKNGPPSISQRDKIQECLWGKKISTSDFPNGVEIDRAGFIKDDLFKNIQTFEQGCQLLCDREHRAQAKCQFQQSIAQKYNARSLLVINDEEIKCRDEQDKQVVDIKQDNEIENEELLLQENEGDVLNLEDEGDDLLVDDDQNLDEGDEDDFFQDAVL